MSANEYLMNVVNNWKQSNIPSNNEKQVYGVVVANIKQWYAEFQRKKNNGTTVNLDIQQSGSKAKGTAIRGKSDIDIFLSFYDPNGYFTLKELYDEIYTYLKDYFPNIRKQNVSIGIQYNGYDIDVVPARKVNTSNYLRYNDHYLWSNKKQTRTLTNIQKHIDIVRNSGLINEIVIMKVWREQKRLEFPSIYLEMLVIAAFQNNLCRSIPFENRIIHLFQYIRDNIESKQIVDPGNSNNILSDDLSLTEKRAIKNAAQQALDAKYWSDIVK